MTSEKLHESNASYYQMHMKMSRFEEEKKASQEALDQITCSHQRKLEAKQKLITQLKATLVRFETAAAHGSREQSALRAEVAQLQVSPFALKVAVLSRSIWQGQLTGLQVLALNGISKAAQAP
jgi:response regulator of citrate/malate metabolism